jgi:hypothetical protein
MEQEGDTERDEDEESEQLLDSPATLKVPTKKREDPPSSV